VNGLSALFRQIEDALLLAEGQISLLSRVSLQVAEGERERIASVLEAPGARLDELVVRQKPERRRPSARVGASLTAARVSLARLAGDPIAGILEERAQELEFELSLAHAETSEEFRRWASCRYPVEENLLEQARRLAESWLLTPVEPGEGESSLVDLAAQFVSWCREEQIDVPVRSARIRSRAAVGADCLFVAEGTRVALGEARRLFVHEVRGHLLPRRRAAIELLPPGRVGAARADMDEEGHAVFLEETERLLGPARRRELAVRHLLAEAVRLPNGQRAAARLALELREDGFDSQVLASSLVRVTRGGGLGREIIYLPGLLRVRAAAKEPELLARLATGRFSLEAAQLIGQRGRRTDFADCVG
jgi:hypothetical protein